MDDSPSNSRKEVTAGGGNASCSAKNAKSTEEGAAAAASSSNQDAQVPGTEDIEAGSTRMDGNIYRYATTFRFDNPSSRPKSMIQANVLQLLNRMGATLFCTTCATTSGANISPQIVEPLIQSSGGNVISPRGNTVLHLAASTGHVEHVKQIIHHFPVLIEQENKNGDLPLHVAATAGHLSTVSTFFLENPQANELWWKKQNGRGNTALHVALENNQHEVAKFLVGKDIKLSHIQNNNKKTPLCIAAEAGNLDLVQLMVPSDTSLDNTTSTADTDSSQWQGHNGKLILCAAIVGKNKDVLKTVLSKIDRPTLINSWDTQSMTPPLTLAAYIGNLDAVQCLLDESTDGVYAPGGSNSIPIHVASSKGYIKIVEEFLNRCPDSRELLNCDGWNILHVAAAHGRVKMVTYMLKTRQLEILINERDAIGDTPLHKAVRNWHPRIVRILTRDKRVNLNILNDAGMTPLDVAESSNVDKKMLFRQKLTLMAWKLKIALRSKETTAAKAEPMIEDSDVETKNNPYYLLFSRENVNTLLLVSTIVATITFAAGFTVPGGYKSSGVDEGVAALGTNPLFLAFLICNTVAMYSSVTVSIGLIWAQTGDLKMIYAAMRFVLPVLGVALIMMSAAFLFGVIVVASSISYCSHLVMLIGSFFLCNIIVFLAPLTVPLSTKNCISRLILHGNFTLLMKVTGYDVDSE